MGSLELGGLLVAATDGASPSAVEILTSNHDPGTTSGIPGNGGVTVVPLASGGFVAIWIDTISGSNLIQARLWDASGTMVANLSPLIPDPAYRPAVVAVGDEFAVAWNSRTTWDVQFMRFDALGNPIVGPLSISTAPVTSTPAMAYSEMPMASSGRAAAGSTSCASRRTDPVGSDLLVPVGTVFGSPNPQLQWVGNWAVVWAGSGRTLHFGLLDDAGNLQVSSTLDANVENFNQFHLLSTGQQLGLAWSERRGYLDPPLEEIRFTTLDLNGTMLLPDLVAVSGPTSDRNPWLYWAGGTYHLLHKLGGTAGIREIEIAPTGTVLPGERYWDHRGYLSGAAYNGVNLGLLFSTESDLFFETGACLADPSPPACPNLQVASVNDRVLLSWDTPTDPESGVFRYHVYRDGLGLAEIFPPTTQFDDGGYTVGATHVYQVRALNGAWNESDACPLLAFSTTTGDSNGDGAVDAADIIYLVNFLLADGAPPAGDGDANGDGAVSVTDIFYLINFIFSDGPPPVPILGGDLAPATSVRQSSAQRSEVDPHWATQREGRSRLIVGSATAAPGATVRIPIDLVDRPGTPLGPEQPFGDRVQALALAVRCAPCDGIAALALEPAGPLARYEPAFASRPEKPGQAALVTVYDEAAAPLFLGLSTSERRQRVATLVVQFDPFGPDRHDARSPARSRHHDARQPGRHHPRVRPQWLARAHRRTAHHHRRTDGRQAMNADTAPALPASQSKERPMTSRRCRNLESGWVAALGIVCLFFLPAFLAAQDGATVSGAISAAPGATIEVPVYAQDMSATPLGVDQPAGSRIQSLSYKVTFTPASSVASKLFARAGITSRADAGLPGDSDHRHDRELPRHLRRGYESDPLHPRRRRAREPGAEDHGDPRRQRSGRHDRARARPGGNPAREPGGIDRGDLGQRLAGPRRRPDHGALERRLGPAGLRHFELGDAARLERSPSERDRLPPRALD